MLLQKTSNYGVLQVTQIAHRLDRYIDISTTKKTDWDSGRRPAIVLPRRTDRRDGVRPESPVPSSHESLSSSSLREDVVNTDTAKGNPDLRQRDAYGGRESPLEN